MPTACTRPTCGPSTGSWRDVAERPERRAAPAPTPTSAAELEAAAAGADARHARPLTASAHERSAAPAWRPARTGRRCARCGTSPRRSSRRRPTACSTFDVYSKRVASRLLAQLRMLERGDADVSERLAHDLLFFCAQAAPRRAPARRRRAWRAARQAYELRDADAGRLRQQRASAASTRRCIAQARKRVAAAKEAWSAVAGGELHRLRRPGRAVRAGRRFAAAALSRSASRSPPQLQTRSRRRSSRRRRRRAPRWRWKWRPPAVPRGVARRRRLRPSRAWPSRVQRLGAAHRRRCARASRRSRSKRGWRSCTAASPTARPWAAWCRNCARRCPRSRSASTSSSATRRSASVLIPVPAQLSSMRGVLSVLGMDQASQAAAAHARRGRRPDRDRGRPAAIAPGRRVRSPGRQPGRARLPDRHAQRAAADGQVAVRASTPTAARSSR